MNIRSNDKDILEAFKSDSEIYRALTTRNHGVMYEENIQKISSAILPEKNIKYHIHIQKLVIYGRFMSIVFRDWKNIETKIDLR